MRCARWITTARVGLLAAVGVTQAMAEFVPAVGCAADKQPGDKQVGQLVGPEKKVFQTDDGKTVHATYFKSPGDRESPVVVLLHMKDGNRFVWQGGEEDSFARKLQKEEFAVITVDLRYHGESKVGGAVGAGNVNQGTGKKKDKKKAGLDLKPADLENMVEYDLEAVKEFIKEEHQAQNLNMNKMGIVGPEMGATIAVYYAVFDWDKEPYEDGRPGFQTPRGQDVRALALISPQEKFHGLPMAKAITRLKDPELGISFLICCGSEPQDFKDSDKIFKLLITPAINEKRMFFKDYKARLTGTDLLDKQLDIEARMMAFFDKQLKQLDAPWRDRESKRNKLDKKKK
jgi:pimeloyl-ACP methyl ester carboxylesterase